MDPACWTCRRRYPRNVKLQLKFKDSATARDRQELLSKLASAGVSSVEPIFPGTDDAYLKSLYAIDTGERGGDVLRDLQREDAVEIAEPAVERRLASSS